MKFLKGLSVLSINMSVVDLSEKWREVLISLLSHRDSFIVQYPEPRPNNAHRWFFVPSPESKQSQVIPDAVGKYLVEAGWVGPELSDEEYRIQIALGSVDCRVYRIVPARPKEMKEIQ